MIKVMKTTVMQIIASLKCNAIHKFTGQYYSWNCNIRINKVLICIVSGRSINDSAQ